MWGMRKNLTNRLVVVNTLSMEKTIQLQQDPANGRFLPGNCLASRKALYQNPDTMEAAIEDYFNTCQENEYPPMVTALALHLGFTGRTGLFDYLNRPGDSPYPAIIKRAKSKIEHIRMGAMLTNKNNVIAGIFDLKNNFGYIDKQVNESSIKVAQVIEEEDRVALKDLAMKMIQQQEDRDVIDIESD